MNGRVVLSIANLVAVVVAFLTLVEAPQYAPYVFVALLAWVCVGFAGIYLGRGARGAPSGPYADSSTPFGGPTLPSTERTGSSAGGGSIDFCIYCGTVLPSGAGVCPACGHRVTIF